MSELIGISGPIGSGKSTVAACLAAVQPDHAIYETWHVVAEIATAFNEALKAELAYETTDNPVDLANQVLIWLPDAISEHLHHDVVWNQLAFSKHDAYFDVVKKNPALLDTDITPETKESFRSLLQWLGNYLIAKLSKTIWYDELFRRIDMRDPTTSLVIVSGVRYPSDAEIIREHNGRVLTVERPGHKSNASDPTESQRNEIKPDCHLVNNGSQKDLQTIIETLWDDIAAGQLKTAYSAA
jgi:energy-coupling factor transporter ATP-binding protein EcfA2